MKESSKEKTKKQFELKSYQALMEELLTEEEIKMVKEQVALEFKALQEHHLSQPSDSLSNIG